MKIELYTLKRPDAPRITLEGVVSIQNIYSRVIRIGFVNDNAMQAARQATGWGFWDEGSNLLEVPYVGDEIYTLQKGETVLYSDLTVIKEPPAPAFNAQDCMAAWEAILENGELLSELQECYEGMAYIRDSLTSAMPAIAAAWDAAQALEYDSAFDWEFLPDLFRMAYEDGDGEGFFDALTSGAVQYGEAIALAEYKAYAERYTEDALQKALTALQQADPEGRTQHTVKNALDALTRLRTLRSRV